MLRLLLSLLFATAAAAPGAKSEVCSSPTSSPVYPSCYVDLTVGIDMSLALKNTANVATLDNSLLQNYISQYNLGGGTDISAIAFGPSTIDSSNYYTSYEDICNYIHSAESQAVDLGLYSANLSEVFTTYRDIQLPYGRLYQKVFVVFTAINDPENIEEALPAASQIRTAGVQVIVVALNSNGNDTTLRQLGDQFMYSPDFSVSYDLASQIAQTSCRNAGYTYSTHPAVPTTPSSNPNDLGNAIGTPCAMNTTNAWLDIVFVVDVSIAVTSDNLRQLGGELATIFEAFTIGQNPRHSTRVAIVTYATDYTYAYNLTDVTDIGNLISAFLKLPSYQLGDSGGNLQGGLQAAQSILSDQKSYRRQVVVMAAATYDPVGFNDANQTAQGLMENGVTIFSISFQPSDGTFTDQLRNLSSPGYSYIHDDPEIMGKITYGLAQVNCYCLPKTLQFRFYNQDYNNYTVYADCLSGFSGATDPIIAESTCYPGILASVTSQLKLDFISDHIVAHELNGAQNYTVGGVRRNGIWYWYNYDNGTYPFGKFPGLMRDGGDYGYFSKYYGLNVGFFSGGSGIQNARPYICQSRACDTDYFCDLANP